MKFEYPLIGVMLFLVLGVLVLIAVAPDSVTIPKQVSSESTESLSVSEPESATSSAVPAPGFEDVPEMIVREQPELEAQEQEFTISLEEELSVAEAKIKQSQSEASEAQALPESAEVTIPEGSGVPGCEETSECFIPNEVAIAAGGQVIWNNDDTAAHTVTSGTPTDGPDGMFDSSLFMSRTLFSQTFDEAGTYDYFCMVHPWMTGKVTVV